MASKKQSSKKKIKRVVRIVLPAGKATPAPPVGPVLGSDISNIALFCKDFNAQTQDKIGMRITTNVIIYTDKTYLIELLGTPTGDLIKRKLGLEKGSQLPGRESAGSLSLKDIESVVAEKFGDSNDDSKAHKGMINMIKGTARSMGINTEE